MTLLLLAYLGGVLTIVSPCILPVLPFVFARAGQPFLRSTLPMLLGMALAFAAVATLAAVGGSWAVEANQYGRFAALVLLALFGLALLFPALADRFAEPLVALGGRLSDAAARQGGGSGAILPSVLLGLATGGEGGYAESEKVIQQLLAETGRSDVASGTVSVAAAGAEMASDEADVRSPETYLGYERAENFVSPGGAVEGKASRYEPGMPRLHEWGLSGKWTIGKEHAALDAPDGSITYRFHARDLHLVLAPNADAKPVRFRVIIDGAPPGADHGIDIDAEGNGVVTGQRLYQLIRQTGPIKDRTFEIRFLDAGAQAYAFTFG